MAKKTYKQIIFTENHDIFTTPMSFAHIAAMYVSSWIRDAVIQDRDRDRDETLGLRERDFENSVSKYSPLL